MKTKKALELLVKKYCYDQSITWKELAKLDFELLTLESHMSSKQIKLVKLRTKQLYQVFLTNTEFNSTTTKIPVFENLSQLEQNLAHISQPNPSTNWII